MLELLGQPYAELKVIHIAGTNGKGTTSALCDAMLRASVANASVGLFTSPHLHSFRERIRVDGRLVSKAAIVDALAVVRPAVEKLGYASPFEKLTALALVCFRDAGCTWAVMETGLGGRWDCTNHCTPRVCGITRIGFDHMNVLGNTLSAIANEKAGIIKPGVPAFSVPQADEAWPVFEAAAAQQGAPLQLVESPAADAASMPAWLQPRHQQHNAAMATAMLASLRDSGHLTRDDGFVATRAEAEATWQRARAALLWPCRFERFAHPDPAHAARTTLLLDVAHNEPAIQALLTSVSAEYPSTPVALIFGANFDKDVATIVALLRTLPTLAAGVAVQSSHPKAVPTQQILDAVAAAAANDTSAAAPPTSAPWSAADSMKGALEVATAALSDRGSPQGGLVLCCGSVFVAAEMREALAALKPALFSPEDWVFEQAAEPALLM